MCEFNIQEFHIQIILNTKKGFRRKSIDTCKSVEVVTMVKEIMSVNITSIFNFDRHFVQQSIISKITSWWWNYIEKMQIVSVVRRSCCFMGYSICSSSGHFVQWNETVWAILVEGIMENI